MFIEKFGRAVRAAGGSVLVVAFTIILSACNGGGNGGNGGGGGGGGGGITDAPNPTPAAVDVISLWSNGAYTDVMVDTWQTGWSGNASMVDELLDTKTAKRLEFVGGNPLAQFLGVETTTTMLDITDKETLHLHYYTDNGTTCSVKVVDFGPNGQYADGAGNWPGDDVEVIIPCGTITQGAWNELNLDVSALATTEHIAQIIFIANDVADAQTFFLDNIYFYNTATPAPASVNVFVNGDASPYTLYMMGPPNWAAIAVGATGGTESNVTTSFVDVNGTGDGINAVWTNISQIFSQQGASSDLSAYAANGALQFEVIVNARPGNTGANGVIMAVDSGYPSGGSLDATGLFNTILPLGTLTTVKIPISCFQTGTADSNRNVAINLAAVNTPFLIFTPGTLDVSVANIRWVDEAADDADAMTCTGNVISAPAP